MQKILQTLVVLCFLSVIIWVVSCSNKSDSVVGSSSSGSSSTGSSSTGSSSTGSSSTGSSSSGGGTVLNENFTSTTFPPSGWSLDYPGTTCYWIRNSFNSFGQSGTGSAKFEFCIAPSYTRQALITPNFAAVGNDNNILKFARAHRPWSNYTIDSLVIFASTNSGSSWAYYIVLEGGQNGPLTTVSPYGSCYDSPSAGDWRWMNISLNNGVNRIAFLAVSDFGSDLYLDNISVGSATGDNHIKTEMLSTYKLSQYYPFIPKIE